MFGHWYVVASQKTIRIFTEDSARNKIKQLMVIDNPLGRERNRALIRKQAGQGVKSIGHGASVRYSENKRHDPHEEAALQFARETAKFLAKEYRKKSFTSLTVVAEPHFLGKLKAAMSPNLKESVNSWIKKDLLKTPQKELVQFLFPVKKKSSASTDSIYMR